MDHGNDAIRYDTMWAVAVLCSIARRLLCSFIHTVHISHDATPCDYNILRYEEWPVLEISGYSTTNQRQEENKTNIVPVLVKGVTSITSFSRTLVILVAASTC